MMSGKYYKIMLVDVVEIIDEDALLECAAQAMGRMYPSDPARHRGELDAMVRNRDVRLALEIVAEMTAGKGVTFLEGATHIESTADYDPNRGVCQGLWNMPERGQVKPEPTR